MAYTNLAIIRFQMQTCHTQQWFKHIASLRPLGKLSFPQNHGCGEKSGSHYYCLVCIGMFFEDRLNQGFRLHHSAISFYKTYDKLLKIFICPILV